MAAVIKIKDENGVWKSVPILSSDGGEDSIFTVTFSPNPNQETFEDAYICDKTYQEILTAHESAQTILFKLNFTPSTSVASSYEVNSDKIIVEFTVSLFGMYKMRIGFGITEDGVTMTMAGSGELFINGQSQSLEESWANLHFGEFGIPTYSVYTLSSNLNTSIEVGSAQPCYCLILNFDDEDYEIAFESADYADAMHLMAGVSENIENIILPDGGITVPANSFVELSSVYTSDTKTLIITCSSKLTLTSLS